MSGQPPHGAPQVAIANVAVVNQDLVQLAAVPAAMAAPTAAAGPTEKTAESQQNSTAPDAVVPTSTEPPARDNAERDTAVRGSLDSTRTETARVLGVESSPWRSSDPTLAPATARFSASVQAPNAPVNSAAVKSPATEVQIIAAPAPAVSAVSSVSTSKTPAPATPVVTRSEGKSRAETEPRAASKPELAPETSSTLAVMQPKSSPLASAQAASPQVASPQAMAASPAPGGAANPTAADKLQAAATVMPRNSRASMPGSAPVPAPKEQLPKPEAAQAPSQQRPQAISAAQIGSDLQVASQISQPVVAASQPAAARMQIAKPPTATPAQATPAQAAPVLAAVTPRAASTRIAPPAATSPKAQGISSLGIVPPDSTPSDPVPSSSPGTQDQSDTPKQADQGIASTAAQAVTHSAPIPAAVAESAPSTSERATPDTPESSVTARSEATETTLAAAAPETPLAPTADNFAFAVSMLAPDNPPPVETKPSATLQEPQMSETKPAVTQPPATATQQPAESQASSNSTRQTQWAAPDTKTAGTRDPKAATLPQSGEAQEAIARWSEVSAAQPSEVSSAPRSSELVEAAHAGPALAAEETHVLVPELPRTSASTEILLHLTNNDQSSAAIRVADRGGSVNVSVHASDPVLRESLRSNLGEWSTQLSEQGWKAEVLKPAAIAAQAESQQDSHAGGQRSSQQQQSFGGDRQPQRDRRAQSEHWQQELEQQVSGGNAHPGGNG
jgi:hypothetical protein